MNRIRTRWLVPVAAALPMVVAQSVFVATAPEGAAGMPMPTVSFSPTDESKVPQYFGLYPNWVNGPQTLADAIVTLEKVAPTPVSVGKVLTERAFAIDYATTPGILAQVLVALPSAQLPTGTLSDFQIFKQTTLGVSPDPSAGHLLHTYVLRTDATVAHKYMVVYDGGEVTSFDVGNPVDIQQGAIIGFHGHGVPLDSADADILSTPASAAKKAEVLLSRSLGRCSSRFSCSNSLIRFTSLAVRPGSTPSSTSGCLTQVRNDSTRTPI